jgi:hypothetical protein
MNADPRSRLPANIPPTKIAINALGLGTGNMAGATLIFFSLRFTENKSVRGHCNRQPNENNVNDKLDDYD